MGVDSRASTPHQIRQLLQAGELRYNPDCRVLNYSMGLPRTPDSR